MAPRFYEMQAAIAEKVAGALSVDVAGHQSGTPLGRYPPESRSYDYFLTGPGLHRKDIMQNWAASGGARDVPKGSGMDTGFVLAHAWEARTNHAVCDYGFDPDRAPGSPGRNDENWGRTGPNVPSPRPGLPMAHLTLANGADVGRYGHGATRT
jgi:hypothetical protein